MEHPLIGFAHKCLSGVNYEHLSFVDSANHNISILSTYPQEWVERYLKEKYYEADYGLIKNIYLPYAWGNHMMKSMNPFQKKIFKEAGDFHIFKGMTIPFSSNASKGIISLSFDKKEKLSSDKVLKLGIELHLPCQLIIIYNQLLEKGDKEHDEILKLVHELITWQKDCQKQRNRHIFTVMEILSDIRAAQMFIAHHETKDLGLETLRNAYKQVEKLG